VSAAGDLLARLAPFLATAALCGLRLLPAALLSPALGGPALPAVARLAVAFGLGTAAAAAAGSAAPPPDLVAAAARELALGLALGLAAAMPYEAARAGGRLADTLRGATLAELHVAPVRQRETATGDLWVQAALALGGAAGADRLLLAALLDGFRALPPGAGAPAASLLEVGLAGAAELVAAGLCLGAPAAAGVLCAELALAAAARAAPGLAGGGAAQPARAALGLAAVALPAAAVGGRLVQEVVFAAGLARSVGVAP
jgi:type III secretory pathway component EscT